MSGPLGVGCKKYTGTSLIHAPQCNYAGKVRDSAPPLCGAVGVHAERRERQLAASFECCANTAWQTGVVCSSGADRCGAALFATSNHSRQLVGLQQWRW